MVGYVCVGVWEDVCVGGGGVSDSFILVSGISVYATA